MQINITLFSSNMNTKYMLTMITAGILAAGLTLTANFPGSVLAASSGTSAESIGGHTTISSHAEAEPGQAGCSTFAALIPHGHRPITVMDISCAASDTGVVGTASGIGAACGTGVNAQAGTCAQSSPGPSSTLAPTPTPLANPNSNSNPAPQSLISLPLPQID